MARRLLASLILLLAAPGAAGADVVHVDCSSDPDALAAVSATPLGPGDAVLLRRGTACSGTLVVGGSGSAAAPIVIGAYGEGRRPRIDATGGEAVLVRDRSHVVVQDLELTNRGDGTAKRRGVHLVAEAAVARDITLRRLYVHDVGGNLDKDADGSGGIQVSVWGTPMQPRQRFDGLLIERNRIEDVSRSGIFIAGSNDPARPRASDPWPAASTGVVVRRNRLARLAGDGIVPVGTVAAIVEDNVVRRGNLAGRSPFDPAGMICNAGIWTFHANGTVIQRNEVSHMPFNGCDGTAFDIDYDQDGTVVQHNLSHHNEGGFILLCTDEGPRSAEVRFNLSIDDGATLHESPCKLTAEGFTGTLDAIRIHNNTFVAPEHRILTPLPVKAPLPLLANAASLEFANNILVATRPQATPFPCGEHCSHNLFWGLPPSGSDFVLADPRFSAPQRRVSGRERQGRGFRLRRGSPAIGAGRAIAEDGGRDYFGNPVADPPAIGFHQPLR